MSKISNLKQYQDDLRKLVQTGDLLSHALQYAYNRDHYVTDVRKELGDEAQEFLDGLPDFRGKYQGWYSEAQAVIRQLLPDRLTDFVGHYEPPKTRKKDDLTFGTYRVFDCLLGLSVNRGRDLLVGPEAAIPHFEQQLAILRSVEQRFQSSLFDIRQLVQADLFDSELDAATELVKNGFVRAAGAMAGVVMEKHLAEVCRNHSITTRKKPTIGNLNEELKREGVIDTPTWRRNQHLGDLRNLCDHHKSPEPTEEQVVELIQGVSQLTKTIF